MNRIVGQLLRSGGWGRPGLIAVSSALATAVVLIAATWTLLPADSPEVFAVIAEPGTRVGAVFGAMLVALAPLLLLDQVVRLGTADRERRQAALRLAGATPREVKRIGLAEVGVPAALGAALAPLVVLALPRSEPAAQMGLQGGTNLFAPGEIPPFLPSDPLPPAPLTIVIIVAVAVAAVLVGSWSSRGVTMSPLGVTRRQARPAPRPWFLAMIPAGLLLATVGYRPLYGVLGPVGGDIAALTSIGLMVAGLLLSAPWIAWRAGRRAERRAGDGVRLIAAQHLVSDPRPAGRAGSALAAIFLFLGGSIGIAIDIFTGSGGFDDSYYLIGLGMALFGMLAAFVVAIGSLAVHSVESMTDRRRSMAALAALGTDRSLLRSVRTREITMVATPLAATGMLVGTVVMTFGVGDVGPVPILLITAAAVAAAVLLVRLAAYVAVLATEPWMRDLGSPVHLRTA